MKRTGVFADSETLTKIKEAAKPRPYLVVNGIPPSGPSAQELAHRAALDAGLPEFAGYYGIDLRTGEFIE